MTPSPTPHNTPHSSLEARTEDSTIETGWPLELPAKDPVDQMLAFFTEGAVSSQFLKNYLFQPHATVIMPDFWQNLKIY